MHEIRREMIVFYSISFPFELGWPAVGEGLV
jgi:hypothetical protein